MGLFNKFKEGGVMDTIQCEKDPAEYLIWKWRPNADAGPGQSRKENTIRSGSSLIVKDGQAAIFQYPQGGYDIFIDQQNTRLSTDNLPVLAGLVGTLFAGGSPFPAQVYFVNLATAQKIPFFIQNIRLSPPPQQTYGDMNMEFFDLRVDVKGVITMAVPRDAESIRKLVRAFGGNDTPLYEWEDRVRASIPDAVREIVSLAPSGMRKPLLSLDTCGREMGVWIQKMLTDPESPNNLTDEGLFIKSISINEVVYDKESETYQQLREYAALDHQANLEKRAQTSKAGILEKEAEANMRQYNVEQQRTAIFGAQKQREILATDVDVRNETTRMQAGIQMEHMQDQLARMREEGQFAQHSQTIEASRQARLGTESAFINAHALDQQTDVMKTGLENMGSMGAMNFGGGDGHMNPAGMMTGMMMGSAVAGQMGQMMGQMGGMMQQNMAQAGQVQAGPPPIPGQAQQAIAYYLYLNNQQYGPVGIQAIAQMVRAGQVNGETLAWCEGMAAWAPAKTVPSLQALFAPPPGSVPPPIPPVPPVPPTNL